MSNGRLQTGAFLGRFTRWSARKRVRLLLGILRDEVGIDVAIKLPGALSYEIEYIRQVRARRAPGKKRRRHGPASARRLAQELDVMREGKFNYDYLDRLDDPRFRGRRADLMRLLAYQQSGSRWTGWRRGRPAPDLRGADLRDLDLRHVSLADARLKGAGLEGAIVSAGTLRRADLRGCRLRSTDFSCAHLEHADLRGAKLEDTLLTEAHLERADLRQAWLIGCPMNRAHLQGADLRGAVVWGVSAWDLETSRRTRDRDLRVVPGLVPFDYDEKAVLRPGWAVRVNDLDVAHFVMMLINNPKIGSVINTAAERVVLLLGRFTDTESSAVLNELTAALPRFGYVPVVFDFDQPTDRDTIETVAILAGLSAFVIANLSQPRSTPLEAHLIIPAIAVPFVPIIRAGEEQFSMFTALQRKYRWVLPTVKYRTARGLARRLKRDVIEPAREAAKKIRRAKHPTAK